MLANNTADFCFIITYFLSPIFPLTLSSFASLRTSFSPMGRGLYLSFPPASWFALSQLRRWGLRAKPSLRARHKKGGSAKDFWRKRAWILSLAAEGGGTKKSERKLGAKNSSQGNFWRFCEKPPPSSWLNEHPASYSPICPSTSSGQIVHSKNYSPICSPILSHFICKSEKPKIIKNTR
jgi:hypothetical protein